MSEDKKTEVESPSPAADQPVLWSEEDEKWLEAVVHKDLHHIAKRYGRRIFSVTMQIGQVTGAFVRIVQSRPPKPVMQALQLIEQNYNAMLGAAFKGLQIDEKLVASCKEDIERLAVLKSPGVAANDKETKSGIIIAS